MEPPDGGARRDRTDDLLLAKQALSQLSYGPDTAVGDTPRKVVGLGRFELPTSPLSGVRSNRLSYRPEPDDPHEMRPRSLAEPRIRAERGRRVREERETKTAGPARGSAAGPVRGPKTAIRIFQVSR